MTTPRKNVRKVPLDTFERAMIEEPAPPQPPEGISFSAWLWVIGFGLLLAGVAWWGGR